MNKKSEDGETLFTDDSLSKIQMLPEFPHKYESPIVLENRPMFLPSFLYQYCPKVIYLEVIMVRFSFLFLPFTY